MPSLAVVKLCIQEIFSLILMALVPQGTVSQVDTRYLELRDTIRDCRRAEISATVLLFCLKVCVLVRVLLQRWAE